MKCKNNKIEKNQKTGETKDQIERTQKKKKPKMPSTMSTDCALTLSYFSFTHRGRDRRPSEGKGQAYVYLERKL